MNGGDPWHNRVVDCAIRSSDSSRKNWMADSVCEGRPSEQSAHHAKDLTHCSNDWTHGPQNLETQFKSRRKHGPDNLDLQNAFFSSLVRLATRVLQPDKRVAVQS